MEQTCGLCRWCCETVTLMQARYAAQDGAMIHAECMEPFLLESIGVRALAENAGYEYRREVETDADGRETA